MATMDIARAYKNLMSDPIDWPLLCFQWEGGYFCDITVPFGARASSFHMQSMANAIVDMLAHAGIKAYMYLDDIIIVSPDRTKATADFNFARGLLEELGLPEAKDKAQPPAQRVKWLGIQIDSVEMSLAIPQDKLDQVISVVSKYTRARSITKKQLQSLIGHLVHVAKCVSPARLFIARLLEALRAAKGKYINVNADMRADLRWFSEFCQGWNGKSYIPDPAPTREIFVDACLSGIGATDGHIAYAGQVAPVHDGSSNITELEALNVVVALHTFLSHRDEATHIKIHCDNMAAVQVLQTGKGRNKLLLDCARAAWMVQAVLGVHITYDHVPGKDNQVADALSRAHLSHADHLLAKDTIDKLHLHVIHPCLHVFDNIPTPLTSRSGHPILAREGHEQTARLESTRHLGQPGVNCGNVCYIRQEGQIRHDGPGQVHGLCFRGVPRGTHPRARHDQEQDVPCPHIPAHVGGDDWRRRPPHRDPRTRRYPTQQSVRLEGQGRHPHGHTEVGDICYSYHSDRGRGEGRDSLHALRRPPTVGDRPPICKTVRPTQTPNARRRHDHRLPGNHGSQMGQEYAEDGRVKDGEAARIQGAYAMPRQLPEGSLRPHPRSLIYRTPNCVPKICRSDPPLCNSEGMGYGVVNTDCGHPGIQPAQLENGSSNRGIHGRLPGNTDQKTWWLEVHSL